MEPIIVFKEIKETFNFLPKDYLLCMLCLEGKAKLVTNDESFVVEKGMCFLCGKTARVVLIECSDDFRCKGMAVERLFLTDALSPEGLTDAGIIAEDMSAAMTLLEEEQSICCRDIELLGYRLGRHFHSHYHSVLRNTLVALVLDLHDILIRKGDADMDDARKAERLTRRFVSMLQEGMCERERLPKTYADILGITPKYLTEICQSVTQHHPTYWIDLYTSDIIKRKLADKSLSLKTIADQMGFSSLSYFSRYCSRVLGAMPSRLRKEQ